MVDRKVMRQHVGRSVEGDAPLVKHEDGIVEFQVGEGVGYGKDDASVLAGDVMKEVDDFALRAGVESTGDFITEEKFGVGDELHGEAEAAFLSSGKDVDFAIGNGGEAGFFEDAVDAAVEVGRALCFDAELGGGFDGFVDAEFVEGDGELGDVADFPGFEVAFFGEISAVPPEGSV